MLHPRSCKDLEEDEAKSERTDFPQSGQKRPKGHEESQSVYDGLAYFGIASIKDTMSDRKRWLRRRIRMYI